ncbi:uncharacterized protein LOC100383750 [Zea mays]|uniref:Regulator of Vps4 activity in the MVB pathway protein n=2 Tax=Zea mays TaxID=4577 RepID=K7U807_MAIZE|nr:uncharacterized protein LOC100383750 [Zea mays]AQK60520.1 Regulator of Vps4 activity in the MVB pathway protein [Zea mays]|eukprot:XP_008677626.1 uncharacterized protein LOC100383750 isoform X1 [Zea mays]
MFDSLLNSKFYNKCKHAIKCTRTRLDLLRRKKQAMVKFLKKDVADLLTSGLESHAFARMEGLIIEMNQASCYDTIEEYCEYIVKQLSHMQKESECPQEALEAVSTLIFAAARFPDLPELCDLRHIFTERYGSSVEPFVNSEFVQNLQNKSFTDEEKLRVMKRVAEEFSVPFDSRALQWKITCGSQNKHDLPKKSSLKHDMERDGHKVDRHAVHERKSKAMPEGYEQKQEMNVKPKDIHVVPDGIGQLGEKNRKNYSDKPSERRHVDNPLPPLDMKEKNGQKEMKKSGKKDSDRRRELMDVEVLDINGLKKQDVGAMKPSGGPDRSWGHADLGLKTLGIEKQEIDPISTLNGKAVNKPPPYSKPYRAPMGEKVAEDRQPVPEKATNMRPPYVKPNFEKHANQGANGHKQSGTEETIYQKREPIYDPVSVRSRVPRPPAHADEYAGMEEKMANQAPDGRRRHSSKRNGAHDNHDQRVAHVVPPLEGMGVDDDINNARPFHRVPSERRKHKSRQNGSTSGSDYNWASEGHESDGDDVNTSIDFGNLLPRAPSSHRKHRSRSADPRKAGGRGDDEERMMDKLLMHYSKKGLDREERKERANKSRTLFPRDDQRGDGAGELSSKGGGASAHRPERAASLPSESASPKAKAKAKPPARSMSMQPEMSRGNVHPSMPDFDELAARISALRNA